MRTLVCSCILNRYLPLAKYKKVVFIWRLSSQNHQVNGNTFSPNMQIKKSLPYFVGRNSCENKHRIVMIIRDSKKMVVFQNIQSLWSKHRLLQARHMVCQLMHLLFYNYPILFQRALGKMRMSQLMCVNWTYQKAIGFSEKYSSFDALLLNIDDTISIVVVKDY